MLLLVIVVEIEPLQPILSFVSRISMKLFRQAGNFVRRIPRIDPQAPPPSLSCKDFLGSGNKCLVVVEVLVLVRTVAPSVLLISNRKIKQLT